jgi:hypothetical protein
MTLDQEWAVLLELNEIRQPVIQPPALPTDRELYVHEAAGSAADRTIARLETDSWIGEVTGLSSEDYRKAISATAPAAPVVRDDTHNRIEQLFTKALDFGSVQTLVKNETGFCHVGALCGVEKDGCDCPCCRHRAMESAPLLKTEHRGSVKISTYAWGSRWEPNC